MATSLPGSPTTSMVRALSATSTTLARNTCTRSRIAARFSGGADTLSSISSRSTAGMRVRSLTSNTLISLLSCLLICSRVRSSPSTTMVRRETPACSAGPTARLSMLKPRRANSPEMRLSTPDSSSTSTERVCFMPRVASATGETPSYVLAWRSSHCSSVRLNRAGRSSWGQCPSWGSSCNSRSGLCCASRWLMDGGTRRSWLPQSTSSG